MSKARISIGTWAYIFNQEEPTTNFHTILHNLQDLGYDGVELGSFGPHPSPVSHPTRASRTKLKKEIRDHGLALSAIAVDLWNFKTPGVSILDEIPAAYTTAFLGWCHFASDLDAGTIRVDSVLAPDYFTVTDEGRKLGYSAGRDRLIQVWDKCSKLAADFGLKICWEFEPGFLFNKPSEIFAIVDGVRDLGNANFGVLYDTCHAHMAAKIGANHQGEKELLDGGALELLHKLKGKITHVHVIDSDGSLNEHNTSTDNPFGTGHLNFDELFPAIQASGVPNDWWCVDLCFWPDAWAVTADSKKFLDTMRTKYAAA